MSAISDAWMRMADVALVSLLVKFSCVVVDITYTLPNFCLCTDNDGLPCEPENVPWDTAVGLLTNE